MANRQDSKLRKKHWICKGNNAKPQYPEWLSSENRRHPVIQNFDGMNCISNERNLDIVIFIKTLRFSDTESNLDRSSHIFVAASNGVEKIGG